MLTPSRIPNPAIDLIGQVEQMREILHTNLSWLDERVCYGLAIQDSMETPQGEVTYPLIYSGNSQHNAVSPDSNYPASSYFYVAGGVGAAFKTDGLRTTKQSVTMNIIFSINVDLIRGSLDAEYNVHDYIAQVLDLNLGARMPQSRFMDFSNYYFNKLSDIFIDMSFWTSDTNYRRHPQRAFRIEYAMRFGRTCL